MPNLTRRGFIGASAAAAGLAVVGGPAFAQQGSATDTLYLGLGAAKVGTIDPIKLSQGVDNWAIGHIYDHLVRPPAGLGVGAPEDYVPQLAESWEYSADAKTWTFHLRQGVMFHKGYGELTSADVKFSYDRAGDVNSGSNAVTAWANVASIDAPDPYTVVINLKGPDPLLLTSVLFQTSSNVVCKKAVEEKGEAFAMDPIGTGPYQFDSAMPELVKLVAYPDYWGEKANVPKMEMQYIVDTSARTFAILGGTADMILAPAGPGAINAITGQDPSLLLDISLPGNFVSLHFNMTRAPFDDVRVRKAFAYAVNRQQISDALTPPTPRVYGLNPPAIPGALTKETTPEELQYNYDPDKARALLAEAGFPNGFDVDVFCSQRDDYASLMLIMQEQVRQIGININLTLVDHTSYHAEKDKDLDPIVLRLGGYPGVATRVIQNEAVSAAEVKPDGSGGNNYAHYGVVIPGIDDLYEQAVSEPDLAKRLEIVGDIERKILEDMPALSVCSTAYVVIRNPRMTLPFTVSSVPGGLWRLTGATKS